MREVWKDVDGYEGAYQVSSWGRVRSLARLSKNGRQLRSRIMSSTVNQHGHLRVKLNGSDKETSVKICLLVLDAFVRPRERDECSYHKDGDVTNNRADNLSWTPYISFQRDSRVKFPNFLGAWD